MTDSARAYSGTSAARPGAARDEIWPALPFDAWQATLDTLHLWTQVIGKVRLEQAPEQNHWWQTPLYVSIRGLTTSTMPYGNELFQVDLDLQDHRLRVLTSRGEERGFALAPMSVADFYRRVMETLRSLGFEVTIWPVPVEVPDPIPFERDTVHAAYDADAANRFWRALLQVDRVLKRYHGRFLGKSSPVHFFWGSFDMAVSRFSGRWAPMFTGGAPNVDPHVMHEAYSHELTSAGFWPGDDRFPQPAFYAYAVPEPDGFRTSAVKPAAAGYNADLGEFILPYDVVRLADDPDATLLDFLESTYESAATLGQWDRRLLEDRPSCACPIPPHRAGARERRRVEDRMADDEVDAGRKEI